MVPRWMTALVLAAWACGSGDEREPGAGDSADSTAAGAGAAAEPGYLRGLLSSRDRPVFVPCNSTDTLSLAATPEELAELRAAADTIASYVVLSGQLQPDRRLTVDRVLYFANEPYECFADWSGFAYRATGQNPGWVAEVMGDRLVLRREGGATFEWSGVRRDSTADRLQFAAEHAGRDVQLTLRQQPCRNPVSQAWSALTAELTAGAARLRGCAVPGITPRRE
jgi:uncharacterized membrane protein